ncbi:hypothetical protein SanaruYs_11750 [Chryseotalea sanaruensis]|uniref:Uncharacterized protein n=2 Tax=Chryseotalea sanaruensis TaxID=2482724 RepID=A0A401U7U7_9BACT|nr:hypothetical protein SanaruYs_11750 [Chryseotalea sanaruensis]
MTLAAQDSLVGTASTYLKNLRDSTIQEIRIVELAEDGSIINLNAIHEFSSNGRIRKSKLFYQEPFQHQLNKFYHYDSAGISETEQREGSKSSMQKVNLSYHDIDIKVLSMAKMDTSKFLFEKIKSLTRNILDTAQVEDYQKISRISILISRNDRLRFTITKANLMYDRIYTEVSKGSRNDSAVWRYDENGALTKTFYGADGIKSSLKRFSKNGKLIFEELFGSPFNFSVEATYTDDGRVSELLLFTNSRTAEKRKKYKYTDNLLTMIEDYSAYDNTTKFLRYDYLFNNENVRTR